MSKVNMDDKDFYVGIVLGFLLACIWIFIFLSPSVISIAESDAKEFNQFNNQESLFITIGSELMPGCFVTHIDYVNGQITCEKEGVSK